MSAVVDRPTERLRNALLTIRSARESLPYVAPEVRWMHERRIKDALADVADLLEAE